MVDKEKMADRLNYMSNITRSILCVNVMNSGRMNFAQLPDIYVSDICTYCNFLLQVVIYEVNVIQRYQSDKEVFLILQVEFYTKTLRV